MDLDLGTSWVEVQRKVAAEAKVLLIDFYAHVMNRRPDDWDGTLALFEDFDQWEVPTISSKDGVHPSNPKEWRRIPPDVVVEVKNRRHRVR